MRAPNSALGALVRARSAPNSALGALAERLILDSCSVLELGARRPGFGDRRLILVSCSVLDLALGARRMNILMLQPREIR